MKFIDKTENLKELQKIEFDMLKDIDKLFKENNITYYIAYGTLLGAIRHKGFIPWDDDIDIHVHKEDYLKIISLFENKETDKYFFQSLETEKNYYLLWNKIRLNNTCLIEKGWEKNKINQGISIDIFPLFDYPENSDEKKVDIKLKIIKLLIEANIKNNVQYKYYGLKGKILSTITKLIPQTLRNQIVKKYIKKLCEMKTNSEFYFSTDRMLGRKLKKSSFEKTKEYSFEGKKFPGPIDADKYLTELYGDYMKLPPVEQRIGHGEVYLSFNTKGEENEKK